MANPIIVGLIGAILSVTGVYSYSQTFGALPLIQSAQLAANPSNGECLTTDGTNNVWDTCAGGPGGSIDGSGTAGQVAYWSDSDTLTSVATGTVSSANSALTVTSNRYVLGGSLALTVSTTTTTMFTGTGGQVLAYTANGWTGVATTTFSDGVAFSAGNVTNTLTAGDALTRTGDDIDFDGGATPSGDLGGTWASPSVTDDSHAHTGTTISGVDISDDTNLTAGDGLTLTLDDLDCDTASGSVFGCLSTTDWTTFNSKLGSYDAWTHPASGISATTSSIIISASSTIGSGTAAGGLTVNGNSTTTLTHIIGGWDTVPISGISSPAGMFTASTTGRSGIEMSNEGGGAAPEFRFSITSARSATDYMSFGRTNADATAGGTLAGLNKTAIGYLFDNTRDLVIGAFGSGKSLYFSAGDSTGTDAILASTGFFGIGTTSPFAPLSVVGSGGVLAGKYTATSTGTVNESAFQNLTFTLGTSTSATSTNLAVSSTASSSALVVSNSIRLFGGTVYSTLATLGNALVNAVTAVTPTGTWDFGGATSLEIVNAAAPTVDATGELAWDTTSGQMKVYDGSAIRVLATGYDFSTFTYSTSTAWAGTTTVPLGPSYFAETWNGIKCFTDTGTVQVSINDGTNRMNFLNSSTTVGTVALTSNNTFTAGEKRYVDLGTPASSPKSVSCTVSRAITAD